MIRTVLLLAALAIGARAQSVSIEVNPILLTVMTAINAAGYDAELESLSNSPIRKQLRDHIIAMKPKSLEKLREFYAAHRKPNASRELSQYISFALCLEIYDAAAGPEFRYRLRINELPPDVAELDGLELLMTDFYRQTKIGDLIANNRSLLDQAIEPYSTPITLALQQLDGYTRNPRLTNAKGSFHIFLDVMSAPNQIHVRSYGNDLFVVLTPSPEPQIEYIRSAYTHFLVDPIAMRSLEEIEKKKSLIDFAQGAAALDEHYKKDFPLLTVACLVRAIEARLAPGREREAKVKQSLEEGFILTPYFYESLGDYEKQEQSLRFYLPVMIQGINLKRESARLDQVKFAAAPRERKAKPSAAPAPERNPAEVTLEEAETLWSQKNYEKAGELFRRALEQTNARKLRAHAYYGLGRLAAINKDPQGAVDLLEKALAEGPEPQIVAWTHVFLGRLFDLSTDPQKAKPHFEAALATPGISPAARKAAEDGLKNAAAAKP